MTDVAELLPKARADSDAPPPTRRHHVLGDAVTIPGEISISGHEQAEKTCKLCGAVRVTVLGGGISRAWRVSADGLTA